MKWESLNTGIGQSVFTLLNNGRRLFSFAFHPSSNAARIEFENEKRVFLFRREGLFRNKIVLCNEYGVRIGRVGRERQQQFVEVDNKRYFFSIRNSNDTGKEVAIFNEDSTPQFVCPLEPEQTSTTAQEGLIMILCWYLFKPAATPAVEVAPL